MHSQDLKRKQEQAEFAKWKGQFSVDETGQEAPGEDQVQQRRDNFCGYIKRNKVSGYRATESVSGTGRCVSEYRSSTKDLAAANIEPGPMTPTCCRW